MGGDYKKFSVYTTDITLDVVYNIRVKAKLINLVYQNETTFDWKVTIVSNYDYCNYYLSWNTAPSITPKTYTAGNTNLTVTYSNWGFTPANCSKTPTYTAALSNGTALPTFITFDASTRTLNIGTTDVTLEGTFNIRVTASVTWTNTNTTYFDWVLTINYNYDWCTYYFHWTYTTPVLSDQTYIR